jgi:hypothetical protein
MRATAEHERGEMAGAYMVKHKEIRSKACREVVVDASLLAAQKMGHFGACVSYFCVRGLDNDGCVFLRLSCLGVLVGTRPFVCRRHMQGPS